MKKFEFFSKKHSAGKSVHSQGCIGESFSVYMTSLVLGSFDQFLKLLKSGQKKTPDSHLVEKTRNDLHIISHANHNSFAIIKISQSRLKQDACFDILNSILLFKSHQRNSTMYNNLSDMNRLI